jgi:hypothetical protein
MDGRPLSDRETLVFAVGNVDPMSAFAAATEAPAATGAPGVQVDSDGGSTKTVAIAGAGALVLVAGLFVAIRRRARS